MPAPKKRPAVYVEEMAGGANPIQGAQTSATGFVGSTRKGPLGRPILVRAHGDFVAAFGSPQPTSEMGYAVSQYFLNGGEQAWILRVARRAAATQFQQTLRAFQAVKELNVLTLPGMDDPLMCRAAAEYCGGRKTFLILDPPRAIKTPSEMLQSLQSGLVPISPDGALYYPWVNVIDAATQTSRFSAPSGTMAGVWARFDKTRGVWKSPAGKEAVLKGVVSPAYKMSDAENATLNSKGINALRLFPGSGVVAWGARTLDGDDTRASEWKYIPVRRLAIFIEQSIERGTQWAIFEPNAEPAWLKLRGEAENFLTSLWRQGAFAGRTPQEAFYVRCGSDTTTNRDIANGLINVEIGFAPLKPAEFVIVRLQLRALP